MKYSAYQDTNEGIAGISIVSCGHIFAEHGRIIDRPMGRSDFLLFYISKGKELFYLDKEVIATDGSFIFFRPNESQKHIYIDNKMGEFYYVHFKAPIDFDLFGFESSKVYFASPAAQARDIFESIISELQMKQIAHEKVCASELFKLISLLQRRTQKESRTDGRYFDKIYQVIQSMNKELQSTYTLDEYASMCNMSKFHFLRVFKAVTGTSPIEYRNMIKIDHAKELLLYTDTPINEIGARLGYSSNSYFCDAFKAAMGISPSQYRKYTES